MYTRYWWGGHWVETRPVFVMQKDPHFRPAETAAIEITRHDGTLLYLSDLAGAGRACLKWGSPAWIDLRRVAVLENVGPNDVRERATA